MRAGIVMLNALGTRPGKALVLRNLVITTLCHPRKWHLRKPLKVCGAVVRGASSLTPVLSFWVTDIQTLAPGLLSDSELNTSHLFLSLALLGASLSLAWSFLDSSVN